MARRASCAPYTFDDMQSTNRLIASLKPAERQRWEPFFERMCIAQREELFGPDDPFEHLWFPESGVCSQVVESADGRSVEVAVTGREGTIGLPAIFGARHAATRAVAQTDMTALRIRVEDLLEHLDGDHPLLKHLERYAAVTLSVLAQIAGCNRLHDTKQRLSRWLLMVRDRAGADELPMTHEFLSLMVGTRRSSVTQVAQNLQRDRVIRYERGVITFIDVSALEARSRECYVVIRKLYGFLSA